MLVASPFALITFARYETRLSARGGDPLIAVHLLRNGAFVIGLVMALAFYMLSSFYLTFAVYLQSGLHDTDGRPLTVRATAYDICMRRIARHSPDYTGKVTVPVLRDHRSRRIVSDESLEIAQMQDDAFDEICGDRCFDLSPARLKPAMDELNTRIARSLSVAVYAVAGARNQQEYEAAMDELLTISIASLKTAGHFFSATVRHSPMSRSTRLSCGSMWFTIRFPGEPQATDGLSAPAGPGEAYPRSARRRRDDAL
jgi:hypothetical protein